MLQMIGTIMPEIPLAPLFEPWRQHLTLNLLEKHFHSRRTTRTMTKFPRKFIEILLNLPEREFLKMSSLGFSEASSHTTKSEVDNASGYAVKH